MKIESNEVNVTAFLARTDISESAKERVRLAGRVPGQDVFQGNPENVSDQQAARSWRLMQAQVMIEQAAIGEANNAA
jgi:hypothetical protein